MLTRKHFQAIADGIRAARHALYAEGGDMTTIDATLNRVAAEMVTVCRRENPRFSADRFLTACGVV